MIVNDNTNIITLYANSQNNICFLPNISIMNNNKCNKSNKYYEGYDNSSYSYTQIVIFVLIVFVALVLLIGETYKYTPYAKNNECLLELSNIFNTEGCT